MQTFLLIAIVVLTLVIFREISKANSLMSKIRKSN